MESFRKRPCLFGWDSISSGFSSAWNTVSNTSFANIQAVTSDIADTIGGEGNLSLSSLIDTAGNVIGDLTPAQVAAGIQPTPPKLKPAQPIPTSPQVATTVAKAAGLSIGTLALVGVGAYLLLGRK